MTYIIKGKNNDYELVVGCEIHAQVASESKLFSRAKLTSLVAISFAWWSLVDITA
jgi:Asp-tRNA(Asn)/Glu-tRNA(Gln) amidotransferase B subunit